MPSHVLQYEFYSRHPEIVARELLGKTLISTIGGKRTAGKIVETEAYLSSDDSAAHGFRGKNQKNRSMFGPAGMAYVYPIHAKYCFNTVTESTGAPSAVLIRALEPVDGLPEMKRRRGVDSVGNLCSGPAKLCQALGIDKQQDGIKLTTKKVLWIEDAAIVDRVRSTTRIGVTSASDLELRFVVCESEFASGPKYMR